MLKTVIETTDGLDAAIIPFYTETDGKFVLAVDGIDDHPQVAALSNAYKATKAKLDEAKSEREALRTQVANLPDDFDAEKWAKLKDGKPDEAALVKLRQELEAERDDALTKLAATQETARKNATERDLTDALTAVGVVDPAFAKAARFMLADSVQIDESGNPFVDTDMGPLGLVEHVKRWTAGEGKSFVDPGKGGGSKGGDVAGGSVTKETFAVMGDKQRVELFRTDPEKFRELSAP